MQIPSSVNPHIGTLSSVSPQSLAQLSVGQQVSAVVTTSALAAQVATIKLDNILLDIKTPVAVQAGQVLQLQVAQVTDKPVFQLLHIAGNTEQAIAKPELSPDPARLRVGQQIPVKVVAVQQALNRVLVEAQLPPQAIAQGKAPLRVDVDVSHLSKSFTVGERAAISIASVTPLAINIKAHNPTQDAIIEKIRQLLPQLPIKSDLNQLAVTLKTVPLPQAVQAGLTQLLQTIVDSKQIVQPQALRQAILTSGGFTEHHFRHVPALTTTDFKAQLLTLANTLEASLSAPSNKRVPPQSSFPTVTNPTPVNPLLSTGSLGRSQMNANSTTPQNMTPPQLPPIATKASQPSQTVVQHSPSMISIATTPASSTSSTAASPTVPSPTAQSSLLTAILQALGAYQSLPSAISVLQQAPTSTALPTALPAYLETMLTSQQASALAQALNKTMSPEQLRASGQFDALVLQGLLREVESLHARVQLNQLSMLKEADIPNPPIASWLIDLPVRDKQQLDFVQLQIDQFKQQQAEEETTTWQVQLRLDTQNLGPVQATVTLQERDVHIVIKAARTASAALLEQHLPQLHHALSRLDVTVDEVSCYCGDVAEPTLAEQYVSSASGLVDISV